MQMDTKILVPCQAVGVVIGKGGDMIKRIQQESRARVQFVQWKEVLPGNKLCQVTGAPVQVQKAHAMIKELIQSVLLREEEEQESKDDGECSEGTIDKKTRVICLEQSTTVTYTRSEGNVPKPEDSEDSSCSMIFYPVLEYNSPTFVSGNAGKIAEVQAIFKDIQVRFWSVDLPEYQGEADFISKAKCKYASSLVKGPVITEDTSLEFNALKGLPGPYIKWFSDKLGSEGLFKLLAGYEDKSASAVCILAYCEGPEKAVKLFHGETKGTIVCPTGNHGFGWDSCFLPEGKDETYAELSFEEKNCISHRRKALALLKDYFVEKELFLPK